MYHKPFFNSDLWLGGQNLPGEVQGLPNYGRIGGSRHGLTKTQEAI